jgi:uncharacterized membrane protein
VAGAADGGGEVTMVGAGRRAGVWLWIAAVLAVLVGVASLRYLALGPAAAPANVASNAFARSGVLVVHAGFASVALILGAFQLFPRFRARWPAWHRRAGTVYVVVCLIAGFAGLVLAAGTSSGPIAMAGFGLLAILWIFFTANAWRLARARDFVRHRRWMIRSYALTFAAVTLRLYLPAALMAQLDLLVSYRAIAFLCWVPNLIVAELWLRRDASLRTSPPLAESSRTPG